MLNKYNIILYCCIKTNKFIYKLLLILNKILSISYESYDKIPNKMFITRMDMYPMSVLNPDL